jgi:hypothetical protein
MVPFAAEVSNPLKLNYILKLKCTYYNVRVPADLQILYRSPRTRSPEKRGEFFIKGQINKPKENFF